MQQTGVQFPSVPLIFFFNIMISFFGVHPGSFVQCPRMDLGNVHAWTSAGSMCVDYLNLFHKCQRVDICKVHAWTSLSSRVYMPFVKFGLGRCETSEYILTYPESHIEY